MIAIDLFAGAGGFTEAATAAGLRVAWAADHDPRAVAAHEANHPEVEHACQDLRQADFSALPRYDVLLASPACQGHSSAGRAARKRGGRAAAKHDADRSTAWAVVDCAEATSPRAIIVENVVDLRRWPLFPVWRTALETLGYHVTEHILDAAHFGVPQNRTRLFVTATKRRRSVAMNPRPLAMVPSSTVLDERTEGWAPVTTKSGDIQARVAKGRARCGSRFLTQHVTGHGGRRLDEPMATITTVSGHWHLVDGEMMRPLTVRELARGQSFRDTFALPTEITLGTRLVGNAVPPLLARAVIEATMEVAA